MKINIIAVIMVTSSLSLLLLWSLQLNKVQRESKTNLMLFRCPKCKKKIKTNSSMRIIFGFLLAYMLDFPCYRRKTKKDILKSSYFENVSRFYKVFCNKPELSFGCKRDFVVNILLKVFGNFKTRCNL